MGAPLIGALRVSLSAETASFEAGMRRAQRTAATSSAGIAKSLGAIKVGLTALAAGVGIGLFTRAIGNALEYAGSLQETAQQLGVTARQLQVYRFAAGQVGVSQEKLEIGLKKLNVSLGQAKLGAEGPKKAFAAMSKLIGVDIVAASKQGGDALPLVADAMAKVADSSKRAASETAVMGKTGSALDNLLSGGSRALNELANAAEKLGIVLSDEQIRHADDAADKLRALKTVLSANIAGVVADNAQSIVTLASALTSLTAAVVRFMSSNPTGAVAIIGALAGSRFGVAGAVIGGAAGALGGANLNKQMRDNSTDIAIRKQEFLKASAALKFQQDEYKKLTPQYKKLHGENTPQAKALVKAYVEFQRQKQLIGGAIAGASLRPAPSPTGDISDFLAGAGKKAKADHSAEEALTRQHQFDQDLSRANIDILNAKKDLAGDYVEQAAIAIQIKDQEKAAFLAEQQYQVALYQLTKGKQGETQAQADQLIAAYSIKDDLERQAILADEETKRAEEYQTLAQHDFDRQKEILQAKADLAETASERRAIELELLKIAYDEKRQALQHIIETSKSFQEIEDARRDLENLNKTQPLDTQAVLQRTRGPMDEYLASLPTTAAKADEALQRLEVQGFQGLIDAAGQLSEGFDSAAQALLQTLKTFIAGLLQMQLQKGLGSFLQGGGGAGFLGALGGIFGGGGGASLGWLSGAGDTASALSIVDLPAFASGGSGIFKGIPGIDKNILSMNGLPIARVSHGERFSFGNDNSAPPMHQPFIFNNYARMSPDDARRTGAQAAAGWNAEMNRARRKGIS